MPPDRDFIRVSPDSTGKRLDMVSLLNTFSDLVYRQGVFVGASDSDQRMGVNAFGALETNVGDGNIRIHDANYLQRTAYVSEFGRLRVGMDTMLFYDPFDGNFLNYNLWEAFTGGTMAMAQTAGFLTLNSGNITTINTSARIQSAKDFLFLGEFPLYLQFKFKVDVTATAVGAAIECGFLTASGASAATEGAFFAWESDGFKGKVVAGGVATSMPITAPTVNVVHTAEIILQNRLATFIIDGGTPVTVPFLNSVPSAWSTQSCPAGARVYIGGTAPGTPPQFDLSEFNVAQVDLQSGRSWDEQMAIGMGRAAWQKPAATSASDWLQTANWSNTAQATGVALSNTAAPAGFGSSLGGDFALTQPAGSATDLIVFAYQVPAGRTLVVRGIQISPLVVTGAAGGANAVQLYWGCGFGASAVSLATGEAPPATWSPRRVPLGIMTMTATAAIGAMSAPAVPLDVDFTGGVGVVESGRFLHIFVKILGGTATPASIWRGTCRVSGTFE